MIVKAQSAVEFMMIVGIAFTLMIPSLFLFQQYSDHSGDRVISEQINSFGREVISAAEFMYDYEESKNLSLEFDAPEKIIGMSINPGYGDMLSEFIVTAKLYGGKADLVFFTDVPLTPEGVENGSDLTGGIEPRDNAFMPGRMRFKIESVKDDDLQVRILRIVDD